MGSELGQFDGVFLTPATSTMKAFGEPYSLAQTVSSCLGFRVKGSPHSHLPVRSCSGKEGQSA